MTKGEHDACKELMLRLKKSQLEHRVGRLPQRRFCKFLFTFLKNLFLLTNLHEFSIYSEINNKYTKIESAPVSQAVMCLFPTVTLVERKINRIKMNNS